MIVVVKYSVHVTLGDQLYYTPILISTQSDLHLKNKATFYISFLIQVLDPKPENIRNRNLRPARSFSIRYHSQWWWWDVAGPQEMNQADSGFSSLLHTVAQMTIHKLFESSKCFERGSSFHHWLHFRKKPQKLSKHFDLAIRPAK